jgi:hypothetical protein
MTRGLACLRPARSTCAAQGLCSSTCAALASGGSRSRLSGSGQRRVRLGWLSQRRVRLARQADWQALEPARSTCAAQGLPRLSGLGATAPRRPREPTPKCPSQSPPPADRSPAHGTAPVRCQSVCKATSENRGWQCAGMADSDKIAAAFITKQLGHVFHPDA